MQSGQISTLESTAYKRAIGKINCGGKKGTCFLITPQLVVTAKHAIRNYNSDNNINIEFWNVEVGNILKVQAVPIELKFNEDIAVLKLEKEVNNVNPLLMVSEKLDDDKEWESFGYPTGMATDGIRLTGNVLDTITNGQFTHNVQLSCKQRIVEDFNQKGASGSPILIEGMVVGIVIKNIGGNCFGGLSFEKCTDFLESGIVEFRTRDIQPSLPVMESESNLDTNVWVHLALENNKENITRFIDLFPENVQGNLENSMEKVIQELSVISPHILQNQIRQYQYPFTYNHDIEKGSNEFLEMLILLRVAYNNMELLENNESANLFLDDTEDKFAKLIYAAQRNITMPEVILDLGKRLEKTPEGRKAIRNGDPLIPYRVILDNFTRMRKKNLCEHCQKEFSFAAIVRDYTKGKETGYFKGIEQNNFSSLDKTKVCCGECLRSLSEEIKDKDGLKESIRRLVN
ncbi:ABC-three component system protein [Bacillus wiedmannii]|uniref:ABC-three component system protein n=1 Tax=Bacillus wiedmannii TaxID=1890302 RepID=UPI0035E390B7